MPGPVHNQNTKIALDGPSALTYYRDRCQRASLPQPEQTIIPVEIDPDGDEWLSDEDIAFMLSEESVFGRSSDFATPAPEGEVIDLPLLRSQMYQLSQCSTRSRDLKQIDYEALGIQPPSKERPLFALVASKQNKRRVVRVRQRVLTSKVPLYSFSRLGDSVYVPSPEFLFALMAHYLTLPGLMLLAMELCGHYRLTGAPSNRPLDSSTTIYDQPVLTNVAKLQTFIDKCGSFSGKKNAQRALKYVADDAASPMESIVYLLLCLPRSLGGYGIPKPILNAKRPVASRAGTLTMAGHLIPDLYWANRRLDLEYDSDAFHADPACLLAGARRTMALRVMKVEVISLTYDIVRDTQAFDTAARLISKKLGRRSQPKNDNADKARQTLRAALLDNVDLYKPLLKRDA